MDFSTYQEKARSTALYQQPIIYPTLGLNGEAGEVAEKVKKLLRDQKGMLNPDFLQLISKELGDVLWYLANLSADLGLSLEEIAKENLNKLQDRLARGALHGSGDKR